MPDRSIQLINSRKALFLVRYLGGDGNCGKATSPLIIFVVPLPESRSDMAASGCPLLVSKELILLVSVLIKLNQVLSHAASVFFKRPFCFHFFFAANFFGGGA